MATNYKIIPWTVIPSHCEIEYEFHLLEGFADVLDVISLEGDTFVFKSNNASILGRKEKESYTIRMFAVVLDQISAFQTVDDARFKITLHSPCFDENFVKIVPTELP